MNNLKQLFDSLDDFKKKFYFAKAVMGEEEFMTTLKDFVSNAYSTGFKDGQGNVLRHAPPLDFWGPSPATEIDLLEQGRKNKELNDKITPPQIEWEKEFDNTLGNKLAYIGNSGQKHLEKIKSFIKSLLASSRQDLLKEVEEIIKSLEGSYKDNLSKEAAYDQALIDLLASLKKLK